MTEYVEFAWKNIDQILDLYDVSSKGFMTNWAKLVAHSFNGLYQDDIVNLFTNRDGHWSDWRTRETWKYATSRGVAETPSVFVNGVRLNKVPNSVASWEELL